MGKPVEQQNHSLAFFILSALIAAGTVWAFWDELWGSRPWKGYQEQTFALEQRKAALDLRYLERQLAAGELKVVPEPGQSLPVSEAQEQLEALKLAQGPEEEEIRKLAATLKKVRQEAAEATFELRSLRSQDDALFYREQQASKDEAVAHEGARRLARSVGPAMAAQQRGLAEEAAARRSGLVSERAEKAKEILAATARQTQAALQVEQAQARYQAKAGKVQRLEAAIEAALDPVITARAALNRAQGRDTQLSQYWLTPFGGAVDRCQSCHVAVDRCGFSRPFEVLQGLEPEEAEPEQVARDHCINPETLESYRTTAEAVCGLEWTEEAAADGAGECLVVMEDRRRVSAFLGTYCGPTLPALSFLGDEQKKAACLTPGEWAGIAPYLEKPNLKRSGGKTWSACEVALSDAGEVCVEGGLRDQLEVWLQGHCDPGSPILKGLSRHPKACASGEAGQRLSSLRPVLFEAPVFAQTHPYRRQLLGENHPADSFGCTVCHEGQGAQTKGVARGEFRHGWDDAFWDKPMLDLVAHQKFRPSSFGPPAPEVGVPGEWAERQRHFVQSSCAKCHSEELSLPHAPAYSRGRQLITELGCIGCHPADGLESFPRTGPSLTALQQKTTPAFLVQWLAYPKAVRPRTKMPNFWPEALDGQHRLREGSPEAQQREQEVQDLAAYLWKQSASANLPAAPAGDPERGKLLANRVGCRACHNFTPVETLCTEAQRQEGKSRGTAEEPGECEVARSLTGSAARDLAPNLSGEGWVANPNWLFAYLKNPAALWPQARMPSLRLSDAEAADLTAYLGTLKAGTPPAPQPFFDDPSAPAFTQAVERGEKLITRYGCSGCHLIPGRELEAKVGTDFNGYGRKPMDLFDFGDAVPNPRQHSWYSFVDLKLRAPHAYRYERVDTRMPQYDLTEEEVQALSTYLKSRTGDRVPPGYHLSQNERLTAVAKGEQVLDQFACRNCHLIGGTGGALRDTYRGDDLAKLAPPSLQAQGWRTRPDWLFHFIQDPSSPMRPWLEVRMPSFTLSDEQTTNLVRSFSARDKVPYPYLAAAVKGPEGPAIPEVSALFQKLRCMACHPVGEPPPGADRGSLAPNFLLARSRLRPDWVEAFILNPQSLQEGTRMPAFFNPEDPELVMYPQYFGGAQSEQIRMLSAYLLTLSEAEAARLQKVAAQQPKP